MPIKTKDGWKSKSQVKAQEKAWLKARATFIQKIGKDHLNDTYVITSRAKAIFKEIDSDGNGKIDQSELKAAFDKLGCCLKASEVLDMMAEADEDGDNHIDEQEFINLTKVEVENYKKRSMFCLVQ